MVAEELARKWIASCERDEFIDDLSKVIAGQVKSLELQKAALFHRISEAMKLADHFTGDLWTDETRKMAKEIKKLLQGGAMNVNVVPANDPAEVYRCPCYSRPGHRGFESCSACECHAKKLDECCPQCGTDGNCECM